MGISDKDYGDALITQQAFVAQQMKEKKMSGTITLNPYTSTDTWASNVSMTQSGSKILNEQDLKHDAMQAPLSALVDMWTMRWQGTWVSETEFAEDDFWRLALIRLVGANKLEKHHLANQYAAVYRIIE